MSEIQATIPFKSRKRTFVNLKKAKSNTENEDYNNFSKDRALNNDDDSSPVVKMSRKSRILKECGADIQSKTKTEEEVKPLPSREKEIQWLEEFLCDHLEKEKSASLYISGQPGTGKTASLTYILGMPKIREGYTQVYINCTMMKSAASIYSRICKELKITTSGTTEKACLSAIEKYLHRKHNMILLILDEIDQLDSKKQSVLYTIFEWPALDNSRIVLVGVANALDLTERTLPRLQARCSLRPATLHFAPYTKQQIINIFATVLGNQDKGNVFSPVALQMLAAKIAAVSGDMRRALDIGQRVIELAKRSKFSENHCVESMMKDSNVTVELKQVLEVLNDVYGGSKKIDSEVEEGLPMQQKLILCSIMLLLNKGKNKEIVMGKLHDVYKKVASSRNVAPLELGEAAGACALLEARGALRVRGGGRAARVLLRWDPADLAAATADKPLLAAILADSARLTASYLLPKLPIVHVLAKEPSLYLNIYLSDLPDYRLLVISSLSSYDIDAKNILDAGNMHKVCEAIIERTKKILARS